MNNVLKYTEKKIGICWFQYTCLTLIFFSSACLYSIEYRSIYIIIIGVITVIAGLYALYPIKRLEKVINFKFTWWIISLFLIYTFYGVLLPIYSEYNSDYILFIGVIILDVIILFIAIPEKKVLETFIISCASASIFICLFIGINEWSNIISGSIRIGDSASGNVNTVGLYLGTFSIPVIYKVIIEKKNRYLVVYIIQVLFMILTGSKKVFIFILIGIGLTLILENKFKLKKYFFPIMILVIGIIFILSNEYFYNIIGFRIIDFLGGIGFHIEGAQYSYSTDLRLQMYQIGWKLFKESPIFGSGWFYFSVYSNLGTYSHNNYIELLVTYGLFGFLLYYGMFVYALVKLWKNVFIESKSILYFVLIINILFSDAASITFSQTPLNYIIILIVILYLKELKIKLSGKFYK